MVQDTCFILLQYLSGSSSRSSRVEGVVVGGVINQQHLECVWGDCGISCADWWDWGDLQNLDCAQPREWSINANTNTSIMKICILFSWFSQGWDVGACQPVWPFRHFALAWSIIYSQFAHWWNYSKSCFAVLLPSSGTQRDSGTQGEKSEPSEFSTFKVESESEDSAHLDGEIELGDWENDS